MSAQFELKVTQLGQQLGYKMEQLEKVEADY